MHVFTNICYVIIGFLFGVLAYDVGWLNWIPGVRC